jgi:predicted aconitase with swiveling domain
MWLLEAIRRGNAPAAILNSESDAVIATGLILGEVLYRKTVPAMDRLKPDAFTAIRTGDLVEVDASRSRVLVWRHSVR